MMSFDPSAWRVAVIGAGFSGVAACELLLSRGVTALTLNDARPLPGWSDAARALSSRAELVAGHHELDLAAFDLIVVSPGVPLFPALQVAEQRGVRIWGEVELATRAIVHSAPIVAVGGTNGKSTVTTLIGAVLARAHESVFVGGNLGEPLALHASERFDAVVLEVSSFQMERLDAFTPHVALLLNVSDDHLDRYPDFDAYVRAKGNMFERQTAEHLAVVPYGDARCLAQAQRGKARVASFGGAGATVVVDATHVTDSRDGERYARASFQLRGAHNAANVAAVIAAVRELGVPAALVREVLATFRGLPHRMELVRERAEVTFYDDSKGTNVGAVVTALEGLSEARCVLVAGGRDKDGSYAPLVAALEHKGRAIVLIGEAADRIAAAVGDVVPVRRAKTLEEAVVLAAGLAQPGDAVLLSPACSSFDMFKDYKERGDRFAAAVRSL